MPRAERLSVTFFDILKVHAWPFGNPREAAYSDQFLIMPLPSLRQFEAIPDYFLKSEIRVHLCPSVVKQMKSL
jgi:hypothetical protein